MISYDESIFKIYELARLKRPAFLNQTDMLSVEPDQVQGLLGRVASVDIFGKEAIPPFDNSSMDGFALRSEWTVAATEANPVILPVMGITFAGEISKHELSKGEPSCVEIMTGAPMPIGADAVVKVEDTNLVRSASGASLHIEVMAPLKPSENLRKKGTDFKVGQKLLKAGGRISSEQVLAFATVGVAQVLVQKRPKIAILSTGNELVDLISDPLSGGMIRNSTAPYLMSALPLFQAEGKFYGTVKDDAESFKTLMKEILNDAPDVILTTGAVSKGKLDFVPGALKDLGVSVQFHGVAIRPGRPILCGHFEKGPVVFAIPGNPISTAVALRFFIHPYLNALQGLPPEMLEPAKLENHTPKGEGLRCFWKASLHHHLDGTAVTSLSGQESYRVSSLLPANAWMILPEAGESARAGSVVNTVPLYPHLRFEDEESNDGGCC